MNGVHYIFIYAEKNNRITYIDTYFIQKLYLKCKQCRTFSMDWIMFNNIYNQYYVDEHTAGTHIRKSINRNKFDMISQGKFFFVMLENDPISKFT